MWPQACFRYHWWCFTHKPTAEGSFRGCESLSSLPEQDVQVIQEEQTGTSPEGSLTYIHGLRPWMWMNVNENMNVGQSTALAISHIWLFQKLIPTKPN